MKIERFNTINERKIIRKPNLIGDFLYDKFFDGKPFVNKSTPLIQDLAPLKNEKNYTINIDVRLLGVKLPIMVLDMITEFFDFIKPYCLPTKKLPDGSGFSPNYIGIEIILIMTPEKVEELKNLPEYKIWREKVEGEYQIYHQEILLKRAAKKYNL